MTDDAWTEPTHRGPLWWLAVGMIVVNTLLLLAILAARAYEARQH